MVHTNIILMHTYIGIGFQKSKVKRDIDTRTSLQIYAYYFLSKGTINDRYLQIGVDQYAVGLFSPVCRPILFRNTLY